jgi:hypothetical protein
MKFRGVVKGLQIDSHGVQSFCSHENAIREWAASMHEAYPDYEIELYVLVETKFLTIAPHAPLD